MPKNVAAPKALLSIRRRRRVGAHSVFR